MPGLAIDAVPRKLGMVDCAATSDRVLIVVNTRLASLETAVMMATGQPIQFEAFGVSQAWSICRRAPLRRPDFATVVYTPASKLLEPAPSEETWQSVLRRLQSGGPR
jgi:hypothetical protein